MANNREMTLGVLFKADGLSQFQTGVNQVKSSLTGLNKTIGDVKNGLGQINSSTIKVGVSAKKTATMFDKMKGSFKYFITGGLVYKGLNQISSAFVTGAREIIEYDQALANLRTLTLGITDEQLKMLGNTMVKVGTDTKFTTTEIGQGMIFLAQAGLTATEQIGTIGNVANLAAGTLSTLRSAADLTTTAINAFGLDFSESSRIVDVFTNAVNNSKLTIAKLSTAMNFVGASSRQVGLEIEDTVTSLALLAQAGAKASTSATGLRQVMSRLIAPSTKLAAAFGEAGVSLDKVNPKTVGWKKTLDTLAIVLADSTGNAVDMEKAFRLFGLRGAQSISILVDSVLQGNTAYEEMAKNINQIGTAQKNANTQMEGLASMLERLAGVIINTTIAMSEQSGLLKVFKKFVSVLTETVVLIQDFVNSGIGAMLLQFITLVPVIYLATKAIVALTVAIDANVASTIMSVNAYGLMNVAGTKLIGTLKGIAIALRLTNPYVVAAVAISGFVAAMNFLTGSTDRAIEKHEKLANTFKESGSNISFWVKTLESATDNTESWDAAILRFEKSNQKMIQSLRDQGIEWDNIKKNAEDVQRVLNRKRQNEFNVEMEETVFIINKQSEKVKTLTKHFGKYGKDVLENSTKVKEATEKLNKTYESTARSLFNWMNESNRVSVEARQKLIDMGAASIEVDAIMSIINEKEKARDKAKKAREKESIKNNAVAFNQSIQFYEILSDVEKEYYDNLRETEKTEFIQSAQKLKNAIEADKAKVLSRKKANGEMAKNENEVRKAANLEADQDYKRGLSELIKDQKSRTNILKKQNEEFLAEHLKLELSKVAATKQAEKDAEQVRFDGYVESLKNTEYNESQRTILEIDAREKRDRAIAKIDEKYDLKLEKRLNKEIKKRIDVDFKASAEKQKINEKSYAAYDEMIRGQFSAEKDKLFESYLLAYDITKDKIALEEEYLFRLKEINERELESEREKNNKKIELQGDVFQNFTQGIIKTADASKSWNETMQDIGASATQQLTDGLADYIVMLGETDQTFKEFAASFLRNIAKMIVQQSIFNAVQAGMGLFSGSSTSPLLAGPTGHAKGAAFYNGVQAFASGGIVNEPTYFTTKDGRANVAGEAGSEGILPLKRLDNGDMGVQTTGLGTTFNINVAVDGSSGGTSEENKQFGDAIGIAIRSQIYDIMKNEKRDGGKW